MDLGRNVAPVLGLTMPWLLIFFLTPIAEMYLLIEVAGYIDAWPTIGLVMLMAVIGVALLKRQGLATLTRGVGRLERGEIPAREMAEGILLAVAGALLLTPGFITDFVGFTLLFPPSRQWIASRLLNKVQVHGAGVGPGFGPGRNADPSADPYGPSPSSHRPFSSDGPEASSAQKPVVIEGDFERRS